MTSTPTIWWMDCFRKPMQWKTTPECSTTAWMRERGGSQPLNFSVRHCGRFAHIPHIYSIIITFTAWYFFYCTRDGRVFFSSVVICAQVREDLKTIGCSAMLDKYDSYTVKVDFDLFGRCPLRCRTCHRLILSSHLIADRNIWWRRATWVVEPWGWSATSWTKTASSTHHW